MDLQEFTAVLLPTTTVFRKCWTLWMFHAIMFMSKSTTIQKCGNVFTLVRKTSERKFYSELHRNRVGTFTPTRLSNIPFSLYSTIDEEAESSLPDTTQSRVDFRKGASLIQAIHYTTLCRPSVFSMRSMTPRVITIITVAKAAMVGSKWYST